MKRHLNAIVLIGLVAAIAITVGLSWGLTRCSSPADGDGEGGGSATDAPPQPGGATSATFAPIDFAALAAPRNAKLQSTRMPPADHPVVRRLLGYGEAMGLHDLARDPDLGPSRAFELAATDLIGLYGPGAYGAVGEMAWADFRRALEVARPTVPQPLAGFTPADAPKVSAAIASAAWRRTEMVGALAAPFLPVAAAENLIDESGRVRENAWPLVKLLHRTMWANRADGVLDARRTLTAEEYLAWRRWQLEASHMPLDAKLEVVELSRDTLAELYDVDRTAVVLLRAAGRDAEAQALLETALEAARGAGNTDRVEALEQLGPTADAE